MADLKISALPASSTPLAGTEILPIVQSATTKQVSVANLTAGRAVSALSLTSTNDATINGVTVGRGGGSVSLNTAVGANALAATSTGDSNAAFGASALASNLGGIGNTATGFTSLRDNTSGNYNVASGYLALGTNLSGSSNVGIGFSVLSTATATSSNTAIGYEALKVTSGSTNTAIGYQSGIAMTTGTKNVILGSYSGNTGTLDIRTTNNNIVLSDGDGNVRAWWDNANARFYGTLLATGITNSALTSGRVTFAGASGVLSDSANFIWDNTNARLGIGTSPSFKLHISTTGNASSQAYNVNTDTGAGVYVGYIASTDKNETALRSYGSGFTTFTHAGISLANFTELWAGVASSTGPAGMLLGVESASPIVFATNNTERMRIDSSGNLGLGVTPSAWNSSDKAFQYGSNSCIWNQGSAYNIVGQNWYHSATGDFRITTGYATRYFQGVGSHYWDIAGTANAGTAISATTAMTLDSSGNLLVGVTVTDPITSKVSGVTVTPSTTCFRVYSDVSNACAMGVTSTGSALINFYYNGANFVGSITTNGTLTSYNVSSDYRLKENIAPMTGALAKVAQLNPVTYKWKSNGSDGQGFIAHELQAVVPDCVTGEKDAIDEDGNPKYQAMDTSHLVATLTAAIQEQQALIESLTTRLTALENK